MQYYFQNFNGNIANSKRRPTPKPIIYVATLQTATVKSHPEYAEKCCSSSEGVFGAESRTGVLLMAVAMAHAFEAKREALFIDSTVAAVPFYRRFFNMQCTIPVYDFLITFFVQVR